MTAKYLCVMSIISEQKAGTSLFVFTFLLVFTMVLHPTGGSIAHLIEAAPMIVVTHAVAIVAIPFGWLGFWGLTKKLGIEDYWSMLGFAMVSVALIAVMLAGTANGIVMPIYLQNFKDASPVIVESIKPIIKYGLAVNKAFDYIYTGTFCVAVLSWSIAILRSKKLALWLGWLGIILSISVVIIFINGMAVNTLLGLRIFGTGILLWLLIVGYMLRTEH
jgi:hypothetical protein